MNQQEVKSACIIRKESLKTRSCKRWQNKSTPGNENDMFNLSTASDKFKDRNEQFFYQTHKKKDSGLFLRTICLTSYEMRNILPNPSGISDASTCIWKHFRYSEEEPLSCNLTKNNVGFLCESIHFSGCLSSSLNRMQWKNQKHFQLCLLVRNLSQWS